ncbi:MAG: hypothetical protein PUC29_03375 [Clostridia bacterium]|nr:hypothetical protein [Clostridia bacterium]
MKNGVGVCTNCGARQAIDHIFENIDVFLCYIENDAQGRRTKDSIIASDIFQKLEAKKVDVFYEHISAADAVGDDLINLRYNAINKAKIVLIIGTQDNYFEKLLATYSEYFGNKIIIPVYSEMRPESMPHDIRKLQALNYDAIGADIDLTNGVLNLLGRSQEIDVEERKARARKKKIIVGIVSLCILFVSVVAGFVLFGPPPTKENNEPQLTSQEIYDAAQKLMNDGKYIEAATMFKTISGFKNSKTFIKNIYNRYDGYYQTEDLNILFYINIQNGKTVEVFLERLVDGNKKVRLEESTTLTDDEFELSFIDSQSNSGKIKIKLIDTGIVITTSMENTLETISIGNIDLEFSLQQRTDTPEERDISSDIITSWMRERITLNELKQSGYEIEFVRMMPAGGGINEHAKTYRIANTDIQLLVMDFDLSKTTDYDAMSNNLLDDYAVCAVIAPAEVIAPQDIGKSGNIYQESDILYYPGVTSFQLTGGPGYSVDFYKEITAMNTIQKDTLIGVTSKILMGEYNYDSLYNSLRKETLSNSIIIDFSARKNIDIEVQSSNEPECYILQENDENILVAAFMWGQSTVTYYTGNLKSLNYSLVKTIDVGFPISGSDALDEWKKYPEDFGEFITEQS